MCHVRRGADGERLGRYRGENRDLWLWTLDRRAHRKETETWGTEGRGARDVGYRGPWGERCEVQGAVG